MAISDAETTEEYMGFIIATFEGEKGAWICIDPADVFPNVTGRYDSVTAARKALANE